MSQAEGNRADACAQPADVVAVATQAEARHAAPEPAKWNCPVQDCNHVMKADSAGRRSHMVHKHPHLCKLPCSCQHGCRTCVPESTLLQGLPATAASQGSCKKRPASNSSPRDDHVGRSRKAKPVGTESGQGESKKAKTPSLKRPAAAVQNNVASSSASSSKQALPGTKKRATDTQSFAAFALKQSLSDVAIPRLTSAELCSLLVQGKDIDAVLRGVPIETQSDILKSLQQQQQQEQQKQLQNQQQRQQKELQSGTSPAISAAQTSGAALPSIADGIMPPLTRVGPSGGLGPCDDFSIGVVVGPSGSGVTQRLRKLSRDLKLPAARELSFPRGESIASLFQDAVSMLPRVGLNNVPAWMRPYHVLSNGQQQRVRLAMSLSPGAIIDDFGNGIDEKEVQSIAHAVGKFIRHEGISRVLIGTHMISAVKFLQPDFVIFTNGEWSVNPLALDKRKINVQLEPTCLGKIALTEDGCNTDAQPYEGKSDAASAHESMRVRRRTLTVPVKVDERTIDAANAFEFAFDGLAQCSIPIMPVDQLPDDWAIGVVVGPSGTGKTVTLSEVCGAAETTACEVQGSVDGAVFQRVACATKCPNLAAEILRACDVPLSCWRNRISTLSMSEAWRVQLACKIGFALQEGANVTEQNAKLRLVVIDEFTTQLDRPHAQALSERLSEFVKHKRLRLVCATVHRDVLQWVKPCWIFDTGRGSLSFCKGIGLSEDSPSDQAKESYHSPSALEIWSPSTLVFEVRVIRDDCKRLVWNQNFEEHHYLSSNLCSTLSGGCFVAIERASQSLVAFHGSCMMPGALTVVREHRLVVLPQWQGFGVGPRLSKFLALRWVAHFKDRGYAYSSVTAHPRLGELRQSDPDWMKTSTNLKPSDAKLGQLGFDDPDVSRRLSLVHGTVIQVLRKTKRISVADPFAMCVQVDLRKPEGTPCNPEDGLGLLFQGKSLRISSVSPAFARNVGEGVSLGPEWILLRVNGTFVQTRNEFKEAVCKSDQVIKLTFRRSVQCGNRFGPSRPYIKEAEDDLAWLYARCRTQVDQKSEYALVCEFLKVLRQGAADYDRFLKQGSQSAASSSERDVGLSRPAIPSIEDVEILAELRSIIPCPVKRKPRIAYSHKFTGARERLPEGLFDRYNTWMYLRVPELRMLGYTHQRAVEEAIAEHSKRRWVMEFAWCDLGHTPGHSESQSREAIISSLGLCLDERATVLRMTPAQAARRGLTPSLLDHHHCAGRSVRIVAVRRAAHKIEIGTSEMLADALRTLHGRTGDVAWLYLIAESPHHDGGR